MQKKPKVTLLKIVLSGPQLMNMTTVYPVPACRLYLEISWDYGRLESRMVLAPGLEMTVRLYEFAVIGARPAVTCSCGEGGSKTRGH